MRRIERVNLANINIATLPLPQSGERLIHDSEAPGLALRLRASGTRTWITLATQDGKTIRRTLGNAATLPASLARSLKPHHSESEAHGRATPYSTAATVREVLAGYLAFGNKGRWKASTGKMMEAVARLHVLPALGDRTVRSVGQADVILWHDDLRRRTTSARMALSTLSGMMRYAEDHGLRDPGSNPCRNLRKKASSTRGSHLPPASIRRLWQTLDHLQSNMPDACDLVRLLLLTGARKGELLNLTWDRIEGVRAVLEQSKTGPRTIWLNAPARTLLDERRPTAGTGFVFPSPRGSGPRASVDRDWTAIREAAGLPPLRLHDLRHHYAAVGVSNGVDLKVVGALLGHHDIDSTLTYAHLATSALVKSAGRVSGLIGRAITSEKRPRSATARPRADRPVVVASNKGEMHHA